MRVSSKIEMNGNKRGYLRITIHKVLVEEMCVIVLPARRIKVPNDSA